LDRVSAVKTGKGEEGEGDSVRRVKWDELVAVFHALEDKHGWAAMDGREAYTRDEKAEHKSMVLGESACSSGMVLPCGWADDRRGVPVV
jgi:hypothetical protein